MRILLALVLLALAACDFTGPSLEVPGTYDLTTINGADLPHAWPWTDSMGVTYERHVAAGRLVLSEDGGYFESLTREYEDGSSIDYEHTGDYLGTPNGSGVAIAFTRHGWGEVCEAAELTHAGLTCDYSFGRATYRRR